MVEVGGADALGSTLNIPLSAGHGDSEYESIYGALIPRILSQHAPELVIVSAGLDLMDGDPLGGMTVSPFGVQRMAASLIASAEECADGRIIFALEGGYDLTNLRNGTQACLDALGSAHLPDWSSTPIDVRTLGDAANVLDTWKTRWTI